MRAVTAGRGGRAPAPARQPPHRAYASSTDSPRVARGGSERTSRAGGRHGRARAGSGLRDEGLPIARTMPMCRKGIVGQGPSSTGTSIRPGARLPGHGAHARADDVGRRTPSPVRQPPRGACASSRPRSRGGNESRARPIRAKGRGAAGAGHCDCDDGSLVFVLLLLSSSMFRKCGDLSQMTSFNFQPLAVAATLYQSSI